MKKPSKDWQKEIELFRNSGLTLPEFCKKRRLNHHTFRFHLYPRKSLPNQTKNFDLLWSKEEFRISLDPEGLISIHGIEPEKFLSLMQSQYHAVS